MVNASTTSLSSQFTSALEEVSQLTLFTLTNMMKCNIYSASCLSSIFRYRFKYVSAHGRHFLISICVGIHVAQNGSMTQQTFRFNIPDMQIFLKHSTRQRKGPSSKPWPLLPLTSYSVDDGSTCEQYYM